MSDEPISWTVDDLLRKAAKAWAELRVLDALRYASAALALDPENKQAQRFNEAKKKVDEEAHPTESAGIRLWTATDEQTQTIFALDVEHWRSAVVAAASTIYFIVMLGFCIWLAADIWFDRNALLSLFGFHPDGTLVADANGHTSTTFKLLVSTGLAGAVGGILDGIRSVIIWHAERRAYGWRFIWKDLTLPWAGAAVAVLVYFVVRSGTGVISGDVSLSPTGDLAVVPACAVGAIAGFSSRRVFRWLDYQASQIFSTRKQPKQAAGATTASTASGTEPTA